MEIIVDGFSYNFSSLSKIITKRSLYDLEVVEPDFDKGSAQHIGGGTNRDILLPIHIEIMIRRKVSVDPYWRVFEDKNSKKRFTACFD